MIKCCDGVRNAFKLFGVDMHRASNVSYTRVGGFFTFSFIVI